MNKHNRKSKKNIHFLLLLVIIGWNIINFIPSYYYLNVIYMQKNNIRNATYNGIKNIPITIHEKQLIIYDEINTESQEFAVNFNNWNAEKFDIKVKNVRDTYIRNWTIQNYTEDADYMYSFVQDSTPLGWKGKPQEIGTNFTLQNQTYISSIYLYVGFYYVYIDSNDKNMTYLMENGTVDIRKNNDTTGVPLQYTSEISVPLRNCIVVNDTKYQNNHVGKTLGDIFDNYYVPNMLTNITLKVPINMELQSGNYWTVINVSKLINPIPSYEAQYTFQVFFYNDGIESSRYVNRSYDNNYYSIDHTYYIQNPLHDMFHIIEYKNTNYTDPQAIQLKINNTNVDQNGFVSLPISSQDSARFVGSSIENVYLNAQINATVNKTQIQNIVASYYAVNDTTVQWNGTITLSTPISATTPKYTELTFPSYWDLGTLQFLDPVVIDSIVGNKVIISDTKNFTELRFTLNGTNTLVSVSEIPSKVYSQSVLNVTWFGINTGPFLRVELWANNSYISTLANNQQVGIQYQYVLQSNLINGTGYMLRGYWDNGTHIGYIESNSFEILRRIYYLPNAPTLLSITTNITKYYPNEYSAKLSLQWSPISEARYKIYRGLSNFTSINDQNVTLVASNLTTEGYIDYLYKEGIYYYAVVATNGSGDSALSNRYMVQIKFSNNSQSSNNNTNPDTSDSPPSSFIQGIPNSILYFGGIVIFITVIGFYINKKKFK